MKKFKFVLLILLIISTNTFIFAQSENYIKEKKENETFLKNIKYNYSKLNLEEKNYDSLYLAITSPSTQSIGSFGGHALLVLSNQKDLKTATAINYFAFHEKYSLPIKTLIGSTTGLMGYIDIRPFSEIAERYTIGQDRSLFMFKLKVEKKEINNLIKKVFELKNEELTYQFLVNNCANITQDLLKATFDDKINFNKLIIPTHLPKLLKDFNLVEEKNIISPVEAKIDSEHLLISKEEFKKRKKFYDLYQRETTAEDNFSIFTPQFDTKDYGTIINADISNVKIGIKNNSFLFGYSFFENTNYETRQSTLESYQVKFLNFNFIYNNTILLDNYSLFEFNTYPGIKKNKFKFSRIIELKGERDINNDLNLIFKSGLGLTYKYQNLQLSIIPDIEIPLNKLGIELCLNSQFMIFSPYYYLIGYIRLPIIQNNLESKKAGEIKGGINLFSNFNLEASYDFFRQDYTLIFRYKYYPYLF